MHKHRHLKLVRIQLHIHNKSSSANKAVCNSPPEEISLLRNISSAQKAKKLRYNRVLQPTHTVRCFLPHLPFPSLPQNDVTVRSCSIIDPSPPPSLSCPGLGRRERTVHGEWGRRKSNEEDGEHPAPSPRIHPHFSSCTTPRKPRTYERRMDARSAAYELEMRRTIDE